MHAITGYHTITAIENVARRSSDRESERYQAMKTRMIILQVRLTVSRNIRHMPSGPQRLPNTKACVARRPDSEVVRTPRSRVTELSKQRRWHAEDTDGG